MRTLAVAAVFLSAGFATGVESAHAAAPRIVIVSGTPLAHQVVISDWPAILRVVSRVVSARAVPRAQLAGRPRLRLSLFWGPRWNDYLAAGKRASALRPRQADQRGAFYPAWHGRPAAIDLSWAGRWPRRVPNAALATLRRFGVPVVLRRNRY